MSRRRRKQNNGGESIGMDRVTDVLTGGSNEFVELITKSSRQNVQAVMASFSTDIIEPPLPFFDLSHLVITNTWHSRCVGIKATVATQHGFKVQIKERFKDKMGKDDDSSGDIEDAFNKAAENGHTHNNFATLNETLAVDLESLGNAYFEVVRDENGMPYEFWHVPSLTIRKRKGAGFWQLAYLSRSLGESAYYNNNQTSLSRETYSLFGGAIFRKVFFKEYGDKRFFNIAGNELDEAAYRELPEEEKATEIVHIKRYHPLSIFYGIPTWIACFTAILGSEAAEKSNLSFFENHRIPEWLFLLSGGSLTKDQKDELRVHFNQILKALPHSPLILHNPNPNLKLDVKKLDADTNEASFLEYLRSNRDEIAASHGVPPRMVGIISAGSLGGSGDAQTQREDFKNFTIEPLQSLLEAPWNNKILPDMGLVNYEMKLGDFEIANPEKKKIMVDAASKALSSMLMTPNEARKELLGLKEIPEDWANQFYMAMNNHLVPVNEETLESAKQEKELNEKIGEGEKQPDTDEVAEV